jgi:hypothetical protein
MNVMLGGDEPMAKTLFSAVLKEICSIKINVSKIKIKKQIRFAIVRL